MAIAFDSSGNTVITTAVTTINVDITSAATGAWCYAGICGRGAITVPSGWTQIGTANGDATEVANVLMKRKKVGGDTTFAITTTSDRQCVVWSSYTGVDDTTPDSGTATNYWAAHTTGTSYVSGSVTNAFTNGWALTMSLDSSSTAQRTWTPDAALTERQDHCSSVNTFNGAQVCDSNGIVTVAAHSYTNVISAAETHGGVYLIYLNPLVSSNHGGFMDFFPI